MSMSKNEREAKDMRYETEHESTGDLWRFWESADDEMGSKVPRRRRDAPERTAGLGRVP
jgi:hypothetical protein